MVAWLSLLAFILQSYVTETHIHVAFPATGTSGIVKLFNALPEHGKPSVPNDATDCPFCQAIVHAGAYFVPATQIFIPFFVWVSKPTPALAARAIDTASAHSWHSRAPPQH